MRVADLLSEGPCGYLHGVKQWVRRIHDQAVPEYQNVSVKTDIYALGIIFYELISGKVPFDASNLYDIMEMQVNEPPRLVVNFHLK